MPGVVRRLATLGHLDRDFTRCRQTRRPDIEEPCRERRQRHLELLIGHAILLIGQALGPLRRIADDGAGACDDLGLVFVLDDADVGPEARLRDGDRKSTRLNSSHEWISYAV